MKKKYRNVKFILTIGNVPKLELKKLLTGGIKKRKRFSKRMPKWVKRFDGIHLDFELNSKHKKKLVNLCKVNKFSQFYFQNNIYIFHKIFVIEILYNTYN